MLIIIFGKFLWIEQNIVIVNVQYYNPDYCNICMGAKKLYIQDVYNCLHEEPNGYDVYNPHSLFVTRKLTFGILRMSRKELWM
jgi:hypothetical protein